MSATDPIVKFRVVVHVDEGTDKSLADIKALLETVVNAAILQAGQGYGPPQFTVESVEFE